MRAALLISTTPHTSMPLKTIDALIDTARRHHIDVTERPMLVHTARTKVLNLSADVTDLPALRDLMLTLRNWSEHVKTGHPVDLTVRLLSPTVMIEITSPVSGNAAIEAVALDILESVELLEKALVLQHVARLMMTPALSASEVVAYAGGRAAYIVDLKRSEIRRVPGAGDVPVPA